MAEHAAAPAEQLTDDAGDAAAEAGSSPADGADIPRRPGLPPIRLAITVIAIMAVALGALGGWLGFRAYQSHEARQQRGVFLQVARQGAVNLTTIDWQHADADIQRILNGATGAFRDDFTKRAEPFVDVVKQAKSTSRGNVTEAGLESVAADRAQALVTVSVSTTTPETTTPQTRAWRMRIDLQQVGNEVKVSNVQFVP
jgi:Mce-associated membrane protein